MIGDRVWLDFNGDGVQDPNEPGLAGVTLTATWAGNDGIFNGDPSELTFTRTTGPAGFYAFTGIPPGTFMIAVTGGLPAGVIQTFDLNGPLDGQATLTVDANEFRRDVDFGYRGSGGTAGATVAGFVYRDLNVDGDRSLIDGETGIPGVTIRLIGTLSTGATFTTTTTTGPLGGYSFIGLPPGDYTIDESQPPSVFASGANGFYNGLDTLGIIGGTTVGTNIARGDNQLTVTLDAGDAGEIFNFGEVPPAGAFGFVYIDIDSDGVRDAGEPGIAGVTVAISGITFPGTLLARPLTAADVPGGLLTIQTDANGRWAFPIVPPGTFSIVETQPLAFLDGDEDDADANGPPALIGNDRFDNLMLRSSLLRGPFNFGEIAINGELAGSVYVDRNNDGFRNAGEVGIPGVAVRLTGTDAAGTTVNATVVTDANGNYRFTRMIPGTYTLTEVHPTEFLDGRDRVGNAGGQPGNDLTSAIVLGANQVGTGYLFGERGLAVISKRPFLMPNPGGGRPPGSGITEVNPLPAPPRASSPPVASFQWLPTGAGNAIQFESPSVPAFAQTFTQWWHFGDGSPIRNLTDPIHQFPAAGVYWVTLWVVDNQGRSSVVTQSVLAGIGIQNGVLVIPGTSGDDRITVSQTGKFLQVRSPLANSPLRNFTVAAVRSIVVFGFGGNDTITINPAVRVPAEIHGDDGNDFIRGGGGISRINGGAGDDAISGGAASDDLFGGEGHDQLLGLAGRDRLFGDLGNDQLNGGDGNDVLVGGDGHDWLQKSTGSDLFIGGAGADTLGRSDGPTLAISGSTAFDLDPVGLSAILAEWVNTRHNLAARIASLRGSSPPANRLNGNYFLTESGTQATILADSDVDSLAVLSGRDWWLADLSRDVVNVANPK